MDKKNKFTRSRPVLQLTAGALVVILYFAVVVYSKKSEELVENDEMVQAPSTNESPEVVDKKPVVVPEETASPYSNGTYVATGSYASPGGREQLKLSITLKDGVVVASTLTPTASNPTSGEFQKEFLGEYKQFVIGKDIATLSVGKVAGSSLTGIGFNAALEQIRVQAKS